MKLHPTHRRAIAVHSSTNRGLWGAAALCFVSAMVIAGAAAAGQGGGKKHGGPERGPSGPRLERHVESLGLDAETLAAVDAVLDRSNLRARELRRERRAARDELRRLLDAVEPDREAIFAQIDRISALEAESEKEKLGTLLDVRALLPEDARRRLVEQLQQEPRGRRGGPPGGRRHDDRPPRPPR